MAMGYIPPSITRQPPPCHHRSQLATVKGERTTEKLYPICRWLGATVLALSITGSVMNINSLPDQLLFEILILLPAQNIYDNARLVCRKWLHMINTHDFIYAHLHRTSYGILFHSVHSDTSFMALNQGQIERSRFRKYTWPTGGCCNGLFLDFDLESEKRTIYITNPATKHIYVLPPLFRDICSSRFQGIAYAAASKVYKVVSTCLPSSNSFLPEPCAILTVGVDKSWRIVRTKHLPFKAKLALATRPFITEGFVHWTNFGNQVLTLNVETEIVVETPPPIPQHSICCMLSGGRYLSILMKCGKFSWEVWELKPESGEWRKLQLEIAIKAHKLKLNPEYLDPFCWLKYLEALVFCIGPGYKSRGLLCNLRTQEIESIKLPFASAQCRALVHKSSLVSLQD